VPTVRCPECGRQATVTPGVAKLCTVCGTRLPAADDAPTVRAVGDDDLPAARPRRRRLDDDDDDDDGGSSVPCPACGSRWVRSGPWPWYLGTVGLMFCKAVVCEDCGHEFDLYKPQADLAKRKLNLALAINGVGLVGIILVIGGLILWIRMTMNP
jgi:hypothetical protein